MEEKPRPWATRMRRRTSSGHRPAVCRSSGNMLRSWKEAGEWRVAEVEGPGPWKSWFWDSDGRMCRRTASPRRTSFRRLGRTLPR